MGLWTPHVEFHAIFTNHSGQPTGNPGVAVATNASANTKSSSWVEVMDAAVVTHDCYGMNIVIHSGASASNVRDYLVDIGTDPTDTATYTTLISNLIGCSATPYFGNGIDSQLGHYYYFQLFIKAGTSIAAKSQGSTGGTSVSVLMQLLGKPKYPELVRAGSFVTTYGADTANSRGAAVTPGTASEGSWTDLSGADTTTPHWYWEVGMGITDSTMSDNIIYGDLGIGDGSNKHVAIQDRVWVSNTIECLMKAPGCMMDGYYDVPSGIRPYGRLQVGNISAADAAYTMAAYAVGGHGG
jgi:hypothetical protein